LLVSGKIEQGGRPFDDFRVRFRPPPSGDSPLALVFERTLRPGLVYLVRLSVEDEVSGARQRRTLAFRVPAEPRPQDMPAPPAGTRMASGEDVKPPRLVGEDNLILLPPPGETVLGLWRATVLVSGERIERVVFYVDGDRQLSSGGRPFSAELRLAKFPVEQVVRAEGYDADGNLVASDEVVVNRPRAAFRVRIMEPPEGARVSGPIRARADVSVPEEKRLEKVTFQLNDDTVAELTEPPWEADVRVPGGGRLSYLTVFAELADGTRSEAVRVLNAGPGFSEQVEVNLVELYVAAQDGEGHLVKGLTADDFEVREEGRPQTIRKFELMSSLPLTLGIVLDTSGSMADSLGEAQRAATEFLRRVVEPGDRAYAVAFSDVPTLLMPPTDDVDAVAQALSGARADGWTVLHDAIITGLSYFRDVEGQQALVLLSDGDDTASSFTFDDALEYARRSEAAIYTIGLDIPLSSLQVRNKLSRLAQETGGRSFYISRAAELDQVYEEIEEELRSRYLLAYTPDPAPEPGSGFREVDVKVKKRGVRTRTQRGYYP
jgi:VWFA-related protein